MVHRYLDTYLMLSSLGRAHTAHPFGSNLVGLETTFAAVRLVERIGSCFLFLVTPDVCAAVFESQPVPTQQALATQGFNLFVSLLLQEYQFGASQISRACLCAWWSSSINLGRLTMKDRTYNGGSGLHV